MKIRIKTKIQLKSIIGFLLLIAVIFISARYCDLHDYRGYYNCYTIGNTLKVEIGYSFLNSLVAKTGAPFYVLYCLIIIPALVIIYYFFKTNSDNYILLFVVFLLYPYINCLQQIRSTIASAIVIMVIPELTKNNGSIIKYIIAVCVASLFHITALIYLLFILVKIIDINIIKLSNITLLIMVLGLPITILLRKFAGKFLSIYEYTSIKFTSYIREGGLISKTELADWLLFLVLFLVFRLIVNQNVEDLSKETNKYVCISYIIIMFSIFRGIANNAYRIAMMMLPILYLTLDKVSQESKNINHKILLKCSLLLFPAISVFLWWGPLTPQMNKIVRTEMWKVWRHYY